MGWSVAWWPGFVANVHEFAQQQLELCGENVDPAVEITLRDDPHDGDAQAENRRMQGFVNPGGDTAQAGVVVDFREHRGQSAGGAEQSEQGGDHDDHIEGCHARVEMQDLVSRDSLNRIRDIGLRSAAMTHCHGRQPGEHGFAFFELFEQRFHGTAFDVMFELIDLLGQVGRKNLQSPQCQQFENDHRDTGEQTNQQRPHEQTADLEIFPDFLQSHADSCVACDHEKCVWLKIKIVNQFQGFAIQLL